MTQSSAFQRDVTLQSVIEKTFDVAIIGGGIFGACALWEATLRGLSAVLVEAHDFGSGASANSFKVVHGGIRYLQHLDLSRLWSSSRERRAFFRIAPHLVEPLPMLIPTYGWGKLGKPALRAGMLVYDLLTLSKNRGISDPNRRLPLSHSLSREEVLAEFPELDAQGLTGGCVYRDGRFYNPPRLVLAFLMSAVERGALAINYLAAEELHIQESTVTGITATDLINGETVTISAKTVLNAAGPWAERLLQNFLHRRYEPSGTYSRDACFVIRRRYESSYTLAVQGRTSDPDAVVGRPARHLLLSPWRDYTLVGVWHKVTAEHPEQVELTRDEVAVFIDEVNESIPGLNLQLDEVLFGNWGLVPFGENAEDSINLRYGKRSSLMDHETIDGVRGLVTLVGVRFTMGRGEAEIALDLIQRKLNQSPFRPGSDDIRLASAQFDDFAGLVGQIAAADWPQALDARTARHLAHNHGSDYINILALAQQDPDLSTLIEGTTVMRAEVVNACRNEMACTLGDLLFRRTDIATGECPESQVIDNVGEIVQRELQWSDEKLKAERSLLTAQFPGFLCASVPSPKSSTESSEKSPNGSDLR